MKMEWISASDAAEQLGCTAKYIGVLAKQGKITQKRAKGKPFQYSTVDVQKLKGTIKGWKKKKVAAVKKAAAAPKNGSSNWLTLKEAIAAAGGLGQSGVAGAGRKGHIQRKPRTDNRPGYLYHAGDLAKYVAKGSHRKSKATKTRVTPKPRTVRQRRHEQDAFYQLRWVFEGLDMGAIPTEAAALNLIRSIVYGKEK